MDPIDKLYSETDVRVDTSTGSVAIILSAKLLFWWMSFLTVTVVAGVSFTSWQLASIKAELQLANLRALEMAQWRAIADPTIRYNTNRMDAVLQHERDAGHSINQVVQPKELLD